MSNRAYFTADGNYGQVGIDDFAILNTEDFTEDDWLAIEEASDSDRLTTALAIHARIWDEDDRPRTNWDNIDNLIEQLREYTYEQDDIELHAIYTDIAEALGY